MERPEDIKSKALHEFLSRGTVALVSPAELADAINQAIIARVQHSLDDALTFARQLVKRSRATDGVITLASWRALARAAHMSSRYDEAEKAYQEARRLSKADPVARGRIDRTLIDVYMYLGDFAESRRRAKLALKTFGELKDKSEIAKTQVNYANLLHRQDRHREAEQLYKAAGEYFVGMGDQLAAARCFFNRANTLVQLFDMRQAETIYEESARIYLAHNHELDALDARWGLSWLHMLEGKFHVALQELADCEAGYRRIGVPLRVASCVVDRAEVFLNLNLYADARDAGEEAEKLFGKLKLRYESAKAAYYRAAAALQLGKHREASAALERARLAFVAEKNFGFCGAVHLLQSQMTEDVAIRRNQLRKAIDYFDKAQLPLWQAVCDLYASFDTSLTETALTRLARNTAANEVPHLFAGWHTRAGDLAASRGDRDRAVKLWEQAADRLDQVRAQLPPVGLRTRYGSSLESPHSRLIDAHLQINPQEAAVWSERMRTAGLWRPMVANLESEPARRRVEESLMALATQVAALSSQVGLGGERSVAAKAGSARILKLQKTIRQELLSIEDMRPGDHVANQRLAAQFADVSRSRTIVQLYHSPHELVAFIHEHGTTRSHRYAFGSERADRIAAQWGFLLESSALAAHLPSGYDEIDEEKFFAQVGDWLWAPLEIGADQRDLLLLIEGPLANMPWQAIRYRGEPLARNCRMIHAPSLRHFLYARSLQVDSDRSEIFVGQADDLPEVRKELDALAKSLSGDVVIHDPCPRNLWPTDGNYKLWHFAGHAQLNRENPFYSSLTLADGPLFAADFRLRRARVNLATLAACQTGAHVALPGEESTGLVRSLLEMGTRSVVAGHWPVADSSASVWMTLFYANLAQQMTVIESARQASLVAAQQFRSAYHWASFSVFGAGD